MNNDNNKLATTGPKDLQPIEGAINMIGLNLPQIKGLAQVMALSGMFQDVRNANQAFVKILAGQEMGIPPFQAMSDIHIIQGKASAGGNIYASKVKQHPKYDYHVKNWTDRGCAIDFYEIVQGKRILLGTSQFDETNAKKAGLLGKDTWDKYARNMYFNRAITNGVRTYCPDVLGGISAYTPDELGDKSYIDAEESQVPAGIPEQVHEARTSANPREEDRTNETITEEPIDKTLLDNDQDPDMPPNFLKYDDEETPDITDDELNNPVELPTMPEKKRTVGSSK